MKQAAGDDERQQSAVRQATADGRKQSAMEQAAVNEMETTVCKMPISEPAVFETLASEPARYELPVFEPTAEADLTDDGAAAMVAAVLSMFNGIETAVTSLEEKMESVELQCEQRGQQYEQQQSLGYGQQQSIGYGQQQHIGHG